ncbi:ABC transporter ATP-binding protein [Rhizobium sp. L1K21]|uniref:ABC transporter ATP-binding protein n=1 Tax=Rhizobium sp. L1K21 TaxID=2954933 RepID=UPI002092D043|nr:ABC transporter ATP-binding protein [Rhizobium sp. L1K21]MCO6185444.1 ABC transporter ATP-binding protein/permease [Rhizobium sp. L1K21]
MSFADFIFRPFEGLVKPLDMPVEPLPASGPVAVLLHFMKRFRGVLILIAILSIVMECINLSTVWGLSFLIDGIASGSVDVFLGMHWPTLVTLGVLIFPVGPALGFVNRTVVSQSLGVALPAAILWQGHKAVERQDIAFFHELFAGQVASRISQVTNAVQSQLSLAFQDMPHFVVQFFGSLILLAALSWPLAMPVLVWTVLNGILTWRVVPLYASRSGRVARSSSLVVGAMTDIYSNIQMVKQFAAEDSEAGQIRKAIGTSIESQHQERRVFISSNMILIALNALLYLATFVVGIFGLRGGFVSIGEFVAAVAAVQRLAANGQAFQSMGQQIFRTIGTLRDAMPVLTTPPTILDAPKAGTLTVERGEIRFDNITFAYRAGQPVVDQLSLTIKPGEKVGLVGVSGAGKSTLVSLLLRFFDLQSGQILIDGQSVSSVTQSSLRDNIGVIAQDVSLLHRSVGDNIRYGRPDASEDEVRAAARMANADEFISGLADSEGRKGYEAYVGERGVKLSGGQRQRVAIARVLLKDAPILILDEATSALDSEAEAVIQANLTKLMEKKTVLAIAHRLSTIAALDRLVVMDKGRIVEMGTHDELVAKGGLYAALWARQSGGFIAAQFDDAAAE